MNTNEIAKEYRLSYWANIMRERTESGLNITAFCKTAGIHTNTYHYWQKKLREAACKEFMQLPPTQYKKENETIPVGWAVCRPAPSEQQKDALQIEIGISRVSVTADTDPELLSKVCRVLVELC